MCTQRFNSGGFPFGCISPLPGCAIYAPLIQSGPTRHPADWKRGCSRRRRLSLRCVPGVKQRHAPRLTLPSIICQLSGRDKLQLSTSTPRDTPPPLVTSQYIWQVRRVQVLHQQPTMHHHVLLYSWFSIYTSPRGPNWEIANGYNEINCNSESKSAVLLPPLLSVPSGLAELSHRLKAPCGSAHFSTLWRTNVALSHSCFLLLFSYVHSYMPFLGSWPCSRVSSRPGPKASFTQTPGKIATSFRDTDLNFPREGRSWLW